MSLTLPFIRFKQHSPTQSSISLGQSSTIFFDDTDVVCYRVLQEKDRTFSTVNLFSFVFFFYVQP